jgi:hypothetical protein
MAATVTNDAVLQIKTLKLESVARDDARWAGMLPVAGYEPVHMAAGNAGTPTPLILKRNVGSPQRQGGKAPGRTTRTTDIVSVNFGHCT